jgi:hypothetical protein
MTKIRTVLPVLGMALLLLGVSAANAAPLTIQWTGTIEMIYLDAGSAEYSGTTVGQAFSGSRLAVRLGSRSARLDAT